MEGAKGLGESGVAAVLIVSVMGTQLPGSLIFARIGPAALVIALLWIIGVWLVGRANKGLAWHDSAGDAPDTQDRPKGHTSAQNEQTATDKGIGTARAAIVFALASVVTLVAGLVLYAVGTAGLSAIAAHHG